MKSKDFAIFLNDYSHLLVNTGGSTAAAVWRDLADVFSLRPTASVSDACKFFPIGSGSGADSELGKITLGIPSLLQFLRPVAKKALLDDIQALERALLRSSGLSVADLREAVKPAAAPARRPAAPRGQLDDQVVESHLEALENTFRDETAFKLAFASLKADARVKLPEAKALAKKFAGETASSKVQAMKLIWGRHSALMESRAKDMSRDGRSAA